MPFQIVRNDITRVRADAIVNTANPNPVFASGTDRAVYQAAGEEALLAERKKIGSMHAGEVNVTDAYALNARYIIHTVGPAWVDGHHGELETLAACYRKSLHLALKLNCSSIAFPLISTGVYGFPKDRALSIALKEIRTFLETSEMDVTLVVFSRQAFVLSEGLVSSVRQFIDDNRCRDIEAEEYGSEGRPEREEMSIAPPGRRRPSPMRREAASLQRCDEDALPKLQSARPSPNLWDKVFGQPSPSKTEQKKKKSLQDLIDQAGEGFQQMLLRLMDEKGMTGPEVYKRANLDKKLFSKIRTNPDYVPKKSTALALAIALKLNLDETTDLLARAGLALSPSSIADLIIRYYIQEKNYDIYDINAMLFEYDQPLLGSQEL